ncbi:MAG: hypothetical protein K6L76_03615 [Agarilytica sp.]
MSFLANLKLSFKYDILNLTIALITASLLARGLSLEDRGKVAVIIMLVSIVSILGAIVHSANELEVGKHPDKSRLFVFKICKDSFFYAVLGSFGSYIFLNYTNGYKYFLDLKYFGIYCLILFLTVYSAGVQRVLAANRKFLWVNRSVLVGSVTYLVGILINKSLYGFSVEGVLLSNMLMLFVTMVLYVVSIYWLCPKPTENTLLSFNIKNKYKINAKSTLQDISLSVFLRVPLLQVSSVLGLESAGAFRIASTFQDLVLKIPRIINSVLKGFAVSQVGGWKRAICSANISLVVIIAASAVFYLIGEYVILLLFGEKYVHVKSLSTMLIAALGPWSAFMILVGQLNVKRHYPLEITFIFLVYAMVFSVLCWYGLTWFGLNAIGKVFFGMSFLQYATLIVVICKRTKLRYSHMFVLSVPR